MQPENEGRFMLRVHVASAHGELAMHAFRRSEGRRQLGCWIVDLDPSSLLNHDIPEFLWRRHGSGSLTLASLSPG
jgi:hypothetical protein